MRLRDKQLETLRAWLTPQPALTQAELARKADVSRAYVCDVVRGRRPPSRRIIAALTDAGLPVEELYADEQEQAS